MIKNNSSPLAQAQGQRIKQLRKKTRLSRKAFGEKHSISPGSLQNWESGRYEGLTQSAVNQLLKAFQTEGFSCTVEWLLYGNGQEPVSIYSEPIFQDENELTQQTRKNAEQHKINAQLYAATMAGRYAEVAQLIDMGANLHLKSGINIHLHDNNENSPLHIAARNGNLNIVKLLIKKGSKVDVRNRRKQTPLHWAAHNGHPEIVDYLIAEGANVDAVEDEGGTPLSWVAYVGHLEIVKQLVDYGSNIQSADMHSNTPLHWACYHGRLEVVKFLIEKGADLHKKNSYGYTPLDLAVRNGHLATVLFLLDWQKKH